MVQIARHFIQSTKSVETRSSRKKSTLENDSRLSSLRGGSDKKSTIVADTNSPPGTQEDQDSRDATSRAKQDNSDHQVSGPPLREDTRTNARNLVQGYKKDVLIQSYLYMSVLFFQYGSFFIPLFTNYFLRRKAPDWTHYLIAFFFPLGGFFNILVYTRPKVISFRRNQPELSWFRAFVMVLKAGVAVPMIIPPEEDEAHEVDAEDREDRDAENSIDENLYPASIPTPDVLLDEGRISSTAMVGKLFHQSHENGNGPQYKYYEVPSSSAPRADDSFQASVSSLDGHHFALSSAIGPIAEEDEKHEAEK